MLSPPQMHPLQRVLPRFQVGRGRVHDHRLHDCFPRCDDPPGTSHTAYLPERAERVGEVTEYLVDVCDVKHPVLEWKRVDIPQLVPYILNAFFPSFLLVPAHQLVRRVDPDDGTLGNQRGKAERDASRSAADVENPCGGGKVREEVGAAVLRCAEGVGAEGGWGVACDV